MKYLLVRDGDITNSGSFDYKLKKVWFCDASRNQIVNYSGKISEGDEIFIAEKGYAIIGKGRLDTIEPHTFKTMKEFINFGLFKSRIEQAHYWYKKFKKYYGKEIRKIHVLEIKVNDVEVFETPFSLSGIKTTQGSWNKLPDNFNVNLQTKANNELHAEIPSTVRFKLYNQFKLTSKTHIIDIDHHVPKSLGGPGNIIENLVPVGKSINRYKSNYVPSKLYQYGKKFGVHVPKNLMIDDLKYFKDEKAQQIAKSIISEINKDIEVAKQTYRDIKHAHFPALKSNK